MKLNLFALTRWMLTVCFVVGGLVTVWKMGGGGGRV